MERIKNIFTKIDMIANHLGSLAIFISFMLAFFYFIFPDLRRYVEVNFTNREAWYRVGTIKPQEGRWGNNAIDDKQLLNFYHVAWNVQPKKVTQAQIRKAINTVAVHKADFTVMGRGMENPYNTDNFKSNNPVIALSKMDDCIYVKDLIFVNGSGNTVAENTDEKTAYVWMRGTKVSCE